MNFMTKNFCSSGENSLKESYFCCYSRKSHSFRAEAESVIENILEISSKGKLVWLKFHLSDISNQLNILQEYISQSNIAACCSFVGQGPANGCKIAVEGYFLAENCTKIEYNSPSNVGLRFNNYYLEYFNNTLFENESPYPQTLDEFRYAQKIIEAKGGTLENNLIRTWIYCRDIDNNYAPMVVARNDIFETHNLNRNTHFITSTGIEARLEPFNRLVRMDSLALFGHETAQLEYMKAPEYLSPTHIYGVAFERGTRVIYGDRSHYYISGTASIDKHGAVVKEQDIEGQTYRMMENVQALLENHGAKLSDLMQCVIYLRDPRDYDLVAELLAKLLGPNTPHIIVEGSVCRPTWLIELEAIAINTNGNPKFKEFR